MNETVKFSTRVYDVATIKKAAYRFADILTVDLRPEGDEIECFFAFHQKLSGADAAKAIAAFKIEVLDQDLRSIIAAETAQIRNVVLAYAFSKSGLQGGE